ncbi:major facilitator superfamily domain-containing protein [Lyophyllum atratum]|nr:major facilitator superfamily domain-containing protein [Lyophyllum atratum]
MFCAAAVSFGLFIVAENYASKPIAPMRLFVRWRWRNVPLAILVRCLLFFHLFATAYTDISFFFVLICAVFLQVLGVSPINAGALVIPFLSMAAISSTITNYFSYRTGLVRPPFLGSLAVLPVGLGLMSTLDETSTIGRIVGYALVCGFGFGCGTQISMIIAQVGLPTDELSTVTALVGTSPNLGGVLGVGIIGTIINNTFRKAFTRAVGEDRVLGLNLNDVVALVERTPAGVDRGVVVQAFVQAWRTGYRVLAGIAVVQLLLALLLRPVEMDKREAEDVGDEKT